MYVCKWEDKHLSPTSTVQNTSRIASTETGHVYITDSCYGHLRKVTSNGKHLATIEHNKLTSPVALDVKDTGIDGEQVFVLDALENHIVVFHVSSKTHEYNLEKVIKGPFSMPNDIALLNGRIYVSDSEQHVVHVLSENGIYIAKYGEFGAGKNQFNRPSGIAVYKDNGEIFVADTGNDRIQVLDETGEIVRQWGKTGSELGQFKAPLGLTIDETRQTIVVADSGNNRIQSFDTFMLGRVVWVIDDVNLRLPYDVTYDCDHDLLVADKYGAQWFAPPTNDDDDEDEDEDEENGYSSFAEEEQEEISSSLVEQHSQSEEKEMGPSSSPCSQITTATRKSNKLENIEYTSSHHEKHSARSKIHRRFVQDALDMKKHILDIKEVNKKLRAARDQLKLDLREKENGLVVKTQNYSRQAKAAAPDMSVLSQQKGIGMDRADIVNCNDVLALEEKLLELQILNKEFKKSIPNLQDQLKRDQQKMKRLAEKLQIAHDQVAQIPRHLLVTSPQATKQLKGYSKMLDQIQREKRERESAHAQALQELAKQKKEINSKLEDAMEDLHQVRLESSMTEARIDALPGRNKSLTNNLAKLRASIDRLGGEKAVLAQIFQEFRTPKGLGAQELLLALQKASQLDHRKHEATKALTLSEMEHYISIHGGALVDRNGFCQAFNDL